VPTMNRPRRPGRGRGRQGPLANRVHCETFSAIRTPPRPAPPRAASPTGLARRAAPPRSSACARKTRAQGVALHVRQELGQVRGGLELLERLRRGTNRTEAVSGWALRAASTRRTSCRSRREREDVDVRSCPARPWRATRCARASRRGWQRHASPMTRQPGRSPAAARRCAGGISQCDPVQAQPGAHGRAARWRWASRRPRAGRARTRRGREQHRDAHALKETKRSRIAREDCASRLPVGSSATRIAAFTMARAMQTRCCSRRKA